MTHDDFDQSERSDMACLRQFARDGSPDAFALLVHRRINLVYSVALRQTNDGTLAEDVTQSVFITLARKAASLAHRDIVLSAWLLRVARLTALDALRRDRRRHKHEQGAALMNEKRTEAPPDDRTWADVRPLLDGAIMSLGEKDRRAIMLRYFEGQSDIEVGDALGISEEAARQRICRARERLRVRLRVRGTTVAATSLATVLTTHAVQAAPAALAGITARAALAAVASKTTLPLGLKGAELLMATAKAKIIVATVAILLCGGAAVNYQSMRAPRDQIVPLNAVKPTAVNTAPPDLLNQPSDALPTEGWQERFNSVYGLAEGKVLKHVPEPFIPERQVQWDQEQRKMGGRPSKLLPSQAFTFEADGKTIHWHLVTMGGGNIGLAAMDAARLRAWEIDKSVPIDLPFPGDWVFRKGASTDQVMAELSAIFSGRTGKTIRFEKRTISREVIVARGTFAFTPLDEYANTPEREVLQIGTGNQNVMPIEPMTMAQVFGSIEDYTRRHFLDESGSGKVTIRVRNHMSVPKEAVLLDQMHRQTGLRFDREKRDVGVWFMVDGDTGATGNGQ